jgi:hypothetical protein
MIASSLFRAALIALVCLLPSLLLPVPADVTAIVTPGQDTLDIILADHKLTAALTNRGGMVPLVYYKYLI